MLIPYYSRMIANLNKVGLKEIGATVVQRLFSEFTWMFHKKDPLNIDNKLKNIRYLSELIKFEICQPKEIFSIWTKLVTDFSGHNIDILCTLIECCGRYLYKLFPVKTKNLLDIMIKKKQVAVFMDPRRVTAIENAFFTCIPPENKISVKPEIPPLFKYIRTLILDHLSKDTINHVSTQLAKLPWKSDDSEFLLKTLLMLHKGKFENIEWVAYLLQVLLQGATAAQEELAIRLVDRLFEHVIDGTQNYQHSLKNKKSLSAFGFNPPFSFKRIFL